jgi:type VI secretion system secreted protein VgrG
MMLKTIHAVMDAMGLSLQKRALHIHFSNELLNPQVLIQRIAGEHRINQGLKAELICLSSNAYIPLKQFIGTQVAVDQVTDLGELYRITGIITGASQGQSDGAFTLYKLTLEDATTLWHKRRNSRVFMNKTVPEISEILFKEWQSKSALFAASLSLNVQGLSQEYDVRPFVMQANETDYAFLTRLWRSEGINWLVDEAEHMVMTSAAAIQAQKLRLIDDHQPYRALSRRSIRFHRSHATERLDSITSFTAQRYLQSTSIQTQRWQANRLSQDQSNSLLTHHQHSDVQDNESLSLEQAWSISPAWTADLTGADQSTASGSQQLDKLNQRLSQYQNLQSKYFTAKSSVRDAQVGYWFELIDHPEIDSHSGSDKEFLILGKTFYNQNNLPKDILQQFDSLFSLSHWQHQADERQANALYVVRRTIAVVPEYQPLQHRPAAYPQRAKVVGPEGETIYVDAWGRIKVRFMFTRADDHAHDGGAGSNDNDADSAWVDVLTPWAGEGYGARFHPRVGEIVVIDFFEGDVDRPFVVGRIHEAERHQTMFDIKGQLPDTKKLSGIRSQEVSGSGFNQLRFDDTTGQISTQLQSSHGASQLNLGHLSHPKTAETSVGRGEGFELRTDQYGAVRAGKGMLISTYAQEQAIADHLDAAQAQSLLIQGHESMKMLSEIAVKQQTDALNVIGRLPKLIQSLELKSTSQALNTTLNLFKQSISRDPLNALKDCAGFIQDMGQFAEQGKGIVDEFNHFFTDTKEAVENLKEFIENVEEHGSDLIKGKLASIKDHIESNPFGSLQEVSKVLANVDIKDFDMMSTCGTFSKGNKLDITPNKALSSLQGFMEGYTQGLESSRDTEKQQQGKLFRQALMLLASPNGIALTTPEDIILQASQDVVTSAQGSINLSAQKNIVAHAQEKISLFAAQKGVKAFAAKGKVEIQAQDDAIEAIARKVIKLISTEEKIEITSPKEIVLTAGGSQIKINAQGIFTTTGGNFESKAGQHSFVGGQKVKAEIVSLSSINKIKVFTNKWDFYDLFYETDFSNVGYKLINNQNNTYISGVLDEHGRTQRMNTMTNEHHDILIGTDDEWMVSIDDDSEEDDLEYSCSCGAHADLKNEREI